MNGPLGLLTLAAPTPDPAAEQLRVEVREFIADELAAGSFVPRCDAWLRGHDPGFSRRLAERGWIGMTWPCRYGGQERSNLERYTVTEELLAAGAPVAAHWGVDRQIGPSILRFGTEAQRERWLPQFAAGRCFVAGALSEPDAGSDLASLRTTATPADGGWRLNGTKVWTSHAHRSDYVVVLCRVAGHDDDKHGGISQVIVGLTDPGVTVRPIPLLTGEHHFNEIVFEDTFVPDDMVLGEIGDGWRQISEELVLERSGPDRFLSTFPLVVALVDATRGCRDRAVTEVVGRLVASLWTLRRVSLGVMAAVDRGHAPNVVAALVKDLGTTLEQDIVEASRSIRVAGDDSFERLLREAVLTSPGFTLRGGTTEILRGIVAKALVR